MKVQNGTFSLPNNSALGPYLRVKLSAGYLVVAGADDLELGTLSQRVLATDGVAPVVPRVVEGTKKFVASGAITQYAAFYAAASGKVSATVTGRKLGIALEATSADGDFFEGLPLDDNKQPLTTQVLAAAGSVQGDAGIVTALGPALIHVTGADATKGIILPAALGGDLYIVKNADAANAVLKVYPATGDAINAIAANSPLSMAAKTSAVLASIDATTWFTVPLLPS